MMCYSPQILCWIVKFYTRLWRNGTGTRTRLKSYLYVVDFKGWLGRRDSNPDTQLQRLQSYR